MIAKEACFGPLFQIDYDEIVLRALPVNEGAIVFDGVVIPFIPRLELDFSTIQLESIAWGAIEMKAVFLWWRTTGKIPLSSVPPEFAENLFHRLNTTACLNEEYYPDHVRYICCLRGWRPSRIFYLTWNSSEWRMIER